MPSMVFSMKMETGLWTLNEIAITIKLPLADPDLLKTISDGMARAANAGLQTRAQPPTQISTRTSGSAIGYTCTISDLDGFGAAEANEHQAMLIGSGLASGKQHGYVFSLSECSGTPAATFRLTATPIGGSCGHRAFCTDQSGTIRSSADGSEATCVNSGTPVP